MNTENGDKVEETEHRKNLNPFADADDDSDGEGDGSFEIGDLEEDIEGRGLMDNDHGLDGNGIGSSKLDKHVGIPDLASVLSFSIHHSPSSGSVSPPPTSNTSIAGIGRATFPSLWPFGGGSTSPKPVGSNGSSSNGDKTYGYQGRNGRDTSADDLDDIQSPDEELDDDSENSSDEGYGEREHGVGMNGGGTGSGPGAQYPGKRRLSVTTEAKRRTSLEDDDEDEEVVHVAMAEAEAEAAELEVKKGLGESKSLAEVEGEGELVEIEVQHTETK